MSITPGKSEYVYLPAGTMLCQGQYQITETNIVDDLVVAYTAVDLAHDRKVAIREYYPFDLAERDHDNFVMRARSGPGQQFYAFGLGKYLSEARLMINYRTCPAIVGVDKVFEEYSTAYVVGEYLEGQSLAAWLQNHGGRSDWNESLPIMISLCESIAIMEQVNLVNPAIDFNNVFVSNNGFVKVLDLGITRKAIGKESQVLSLGLSQGSLPGNASINKNTLHRNTSVYHLASIVFRMLTGSFPGESGIDITACINAPPGIPESAKSAILLALTGMGGIFPSTRDFCAALTSELASDKDGSLPESPGEYPAPEPREKEETGSPAIQGSEAPLPALSAATTHITPSINQPDIEVLPAQSPPPADNQPLVNLTEKNEASLTSTKRPSRPKLGKPEYRPIMVRLFITLIFVCIMAASGGPITNPDRWIQHSPPANPMSKNGEATVHKTTSSDGTTRDAYLPAGITPAEWPADWPADIPKFTYGTIVKIPQVEQAAATIKPLTKVVCFAYASDDAYTKYENDLKKAGWNTTLFDQDGNTMLGAVKNRTCVSMAIIDKTGAMRAGYVAYGELPPSNEVPSQ